MHVTYRAVSALSVTPPRALVLAGPAIFDTPAVERSKSISAGGGDSEGQYCRQSHQCSSAYVVAQSRHAFQNLRSRPLIHDFYTTRVVNDF